MKEAKPPLLRIFERLKDRVGLVNFGIWRVVLR